MEFRKMVNDNPICKTEKETQMYVQNRLLDSVGEGLLDSVGEGEGGIFWENSMYII